MAMHCFIHASSLILQIQSLPKPSIAKLEFWCYTIRIESLHTLTHTHSLRAQFSVEGVELNQLHGSANSEEASKELEYFFPVEKTLAVIKPGAINEKGVQCDMV